MRDLVKRLRLQERERAAVGDGHLFGEAAKTIEWLDRVTDEQIMLINAQEAKITRLETELVDANAGHGRGRGHGLGVPSSRGDGSGLDMPETNNCPKEA